MAVESVMKNVVMIIDVATKLTTDCSVGNAEPRVQDQTSHISLIF